MFFTVLAPGDELGVDAFLEMAMAAAMHADADFLYSDERCRNPASGAVEAYFKPQWSPDLMLSTNYVGRLWCARADLLRSRRRPDGAVAGPRRIRSGAALHRGGQGDPAHPGGAVRARAMTASTPRRKRKQALERMLARRGIAGEIRGGFGSRHLSGEARAGEAGAGLDHHSDLRRARA